MPNSLSSTGLTTATQSELLNSLTTSLQAIYGSDINLASDTPDGQLVNIFIQAILDIEDLITQVYNSMDPDLAIGNVLDQRVAINGIQRQAGTFTTTNITITTTQSVNLYGIDQSAQPVYTVADNLGNQWELISTVLALPVGANVLLFQSATPGANVPVPNTITVPVTIILGVSSINNPTTYNILGLNEESDAALRLRRMKSVALSSQGFLQGLLAALSNINGISSAFVFENTSANTDSNGVPGHSIWVIVAGTPSIPVTPPWSSATTYSYGNIASVGSVNYISWQNNNINHDPTTSPLFWGVYNPVAQAIYAKRNAGCGMKGSTSYTITQVDGTGFTVYWDLVTQINLFITFQVASLDKINIPNMSLIRSSLPTDFVPGVFEEVNVNKLATIVQEIDSNTLVTNAGFGLSSVGPFSLFLTPAQKNYQFLTSSPDIIILPMLLNSLNASPTFNSSNQVTQMNTTVAHGGATIQFSGLGGYGTLTYSMQSGGGSINSVSGLYTSGVAGTDTVKVQDSLGNSAISVVTVT